MYIKFLAHGKGDPAKAASYLIDEVDHLNRPRADVQVLRGDPQTFTAIAESIQNEWKYTSGVIAWSKDDAPTNDEIDQVLEAFEKHAFAGLKPNQYHFTAVLHEEDDGSKHVHFLVPRIELDTGKALNIAPPGHEKYFDPLRDYFNYSKGWSRPDDPTLQHDTQTPDHAHFQDAAAVRAGLKGKSVNDIREVVGSLIEQRIYFDFIKDRTDVLDAVSELGKVTRISDKFISLKLDGADKAIRLKGAFYESEFSVESYFENRTRETSDARASRENRFIPEEHKKLAEQLEKRFTELAGGRSKYNEGRYQSLERSQTEPKFSPNRESEFSRTFTAANGRNSQPFEPTGRAARAVKSPISSIEQHEPRNSRNSQDQENPFYIKYSFSFDSSYFDYQQFFIRIRQQEQIQRYTSDAEQSRLSEKSGGEHDNNNVRRETVRRVRPEISRHELRTGQWNKTPSNSERDTLNELRSTIIEDYRAAAAAAQRATEAARASITAHSNAEQNDKRTRELLQQIDNSLQYADRERKGDEKSYQTATESEAVRDFITELGEQLNTAITEPFRAISDRVKSKERDQRTIANDDLYRNREADSTINPTASKETRLSTTVSRKIRGFDQTNIFKALDELDRRRELQLEKQRKNDRSYSPRF